MTGPHSFWELDPEVIYLNHGSFGPSPKPVMDASRRWTEQLERQPMEFFIRRMEDHLGDTCERLGRFIGTKGHNLALVDNATVGMNIVAAAVPLEPGDEVLLTDHEYGVVQRIWKRRCQQAGAKAIVRRLPLESGDSDLVADDFLQGVTERTRLIVASHVTSLTAIILPVERICRGARERGVPVCVDGPHAVGMLPLNLKQLGCDFYCASCHKWLCAPFGSGFLYVHPKHHARLKPVTVSWGGSLSGRAPRWQDEFDWMGTRDPAPRLAISAAIDFLERVGIEHFRDHGHRLAQYARQRIASLTGLESLVPDSPDWYGTMTACPLPKPDGWQPVAHGLWDDLQQQLFEQHSIEVPVFGWNEQRLMRVSCHLYNTRDQIDRLVDAVGGLLST